jgi:hypothetical protein
MICTWQVARNLTCQDRLILINVQAQMANLAGLVKTAKGNKIINTKNATITGS